MNATTGASRRFLATLAAILLFVFALPAPAAAQGPSKLINFPAEKFNIAPGGVDMRTGRFVYGETDLASGPLALKRTMPDRVANHVNPFGNFSHNWDIFLLETRVDIYGGNKVGNDYRMTVHHGGRAMTFEGYGNSSGYASKSDDSFPMLTVSGDRASGAAVHVYELQGTVLTFRSIGSADCADEAWGSGRRRCAYVSEMVEPDGTRYTFQYANVSAGTGNRSRLSRVTSSRGYALILEGSGHKVAKACVLNLAVTNLPANDACPAGAPAASYAYEAGGRLASATGPGGSASGFTYSAGPDQAGTMGFVKPGQTAPWLTNHIGYVADEEYALQEIVGAQYFADGQTYGYSFDRGPATTPRPTPAIAGGRYVDAESRLTQVLYGFPLMPGSGPTYVCSTRPCNLDAPDDFMNYTYQQTPGPVEIIDPLGRSTRMDYCDPLMLATPEPYGGCAVYPLQWSEDPEGLKTQLGYDGQRNITKATRHPRPGVLNPDGSTPAPIVTEAGYDLVNPKAATRPLWIKDANGNITTWTYAPEHGGVLTETGPAVNSVVPQKRHSYVQRTARFADGTSAAAPIWLLDSLSSCRTGNPGPNNVGCALGAPDEIVTRYDYGPATGPNTLLLLGQSVTADGTTLRTCFAYDGQGRKVSETSPNGTAGLAACPASAPTGPLPWTTSTRYDAEGQVTGTIAPDPDGGGPLPFPAVRNSYDPAGRLIRVEEGALAAWQPEWVAPALWPGFAVHRIVDTSYDALDRKTREAVTGGGVTEYSYDLSGRPRCTAVRMNPDHWGTPLADKCVPGPAHPVNGFDRISKNVYDAAGQLTESWDGVGTPLARREALYTHNGNDQKTSLTDARGYRAEMAYDGHGRQQRWVFPSRTTPGVADAGDYEQYLYDPNGNRTSLRKRDGSVLGYWYDALNRMTAKIVPERAGLTAAQTRDVHYDYDLRGLQTKARFDSLAGEGVTTAYDGFGRAISSTLAMAGTSRTIGHQYDGEGNRTRITHPDGAFFPYDYDGLGRFLRVGENGPDTLVAFSYDNAGHRSGLASGGMSSAFAHDPAGRPVSLAHDLAGTAGDQTIGLGYNPASQIVSRTGTNDAFAWTGSVAVDRPYAVNGLNQYSSAGASTFGYDPNGNLIAATQPPYTSNYVYDVENRLVSASGAQTALLVYDPLGRLFQVSGWASGATQFLYDDDALIAEYNLAGTMVHRYIHGALKGVDDPLIWYDNLASGWRRPLIADQQGSIVAVADMYGNPVAINAYDEYGIPKFGNVGRFQYTGQAWIPELGMYHYKSRLYSATLGRFMQTDTIGYEGGINLYAYVDNDPVNEEDPTGNCPWCVKAAVDFGIEVGIQYLTTGKVNLGQAARNTAVGMVNPLKTLERARTLGRIARAATQARAVRKACCFVAGTLVDTEDGLRPIESIKEGDRVWAQDVATGQIALKKVLGATPRHDRPIWRVSIGSPGDAGEEFQTTEEHPWWISGLGWTLTQDLAAGMSVITRDGRIATVSTVTRPRAMAETYNISVEDFETYFVGINRILVHNCNIPKSPRGPGAVPPSQRDPKRFYTRGETREALAQQGGNCAQCQKPKTLNEVAGHHTQRHADGGRTDRENLRAVCPDCHKKIHGKE